MNMLLLLSVCSALLMWTCSGNTEGDEGSTDYVATTSYYDYDYNATFDYIDYHKGNSDQHGQRSHSPSPSEASSTEELSPVLALGLAVLRIWI